MDTDKLFKNMQEFILTFFIDLDSIHKFVKSFNT